MFGKKPKKVILRRLTREVDQDGRVHYIQTEKEVDKMNMKATGRVKHVTGDAKRYCEVDMDPIYPDYAEPRIEEDGTASGNFFDAIGYHFYFVDPRIQEGFDELGKPKVQRALPDWKVLLVVGIFAAVAIWMVTRMMQ